MKILDDFRSGYTAESALQLRRLLRALVRAPDHEQRYISRIAEPLVPVCISAIKKDSIYAGAGLD